MTMQATATATATSTFTAQPNVVVPTISSSALFVELTISVWTARRLDKTASRAVTANNNAASGVANVNKKLLGDCAELDAIQKFAGNARNLHYSMTMPWSDMGLRLIPTAMYLGKYHKTMTEMQTEFYRLVDVFLNAYQWEIGQAQVKLGSLFNPDEYPSTDALRGKFRFMLNEMPVPDVGDFRLDINNEAMQTLTTKYTDYYTSQLNNAMNDLWKRTHDVLAKMSERLDYGFSDVNGTAGAGTNNVAKKVFRDSLVDNVVEMVELLDVCNITQDSQMAAMRNRLEQTLRGVTPEALREDDWLRMETKRSVDAIIKSLPSIDL
jgi:hypothetical protein